MSAFCRREWAGDGQLYSSVHVMSAGLPEWRGCMLVCIQYKAT